MSRTVAHVEEMWTEVLSLFDQRTLGVVPETQTKLFKICCVKRRHLICTCSPDYRVSINDNKVRIVTAGCLHLSGVCGGHLERTGGMRTKDGRRWTTVSTITLTRHGHALFDWRHVAQALE